MAFREMRRRKQAVSDAVCREILRTAGRAVLSVIGEDGYPYGVPVNFYYEEADDTLYIHGAKEGSKLDAIRTTDKVCFTTWNDGEYTDGDWAPYVTSVIVRGTAELPSDPVQTEREVRKMGLKYYPDADAVEQEMHAVSRVQLIAVHILHMTGKRVQEK